MNVSETKIPDVLRIAPKRFRDSRGFFCETWNSRQLRDAGVDIDFVQDNQSFSAEAGTVRGLHFQSPPAAQAKLVRVAQGAVLDIAVDIRQSSPTFGHWVAEELSDENGAQLLIPAGFLHGFATLQPHTTVIYKVDAHYVPECEGCVRFDDPDLSIDWGIDPAKAILSEKDSAAPSFAELVSPFITRRAA